MPDARASIFELDWHRSKGLPMPARTIYEYATREDAEKAASFLVKEKGQVASWIGNDLAATYNGTAYVVTYAGANEPSV